jgi:hypothetical protein
MRAMRAMQVLHVAVATGAASSSPNVAVSIVTIASLVLAAAALIWTSLSWIRNRRSQDYLLKVVTRQVAEQEQVLKEQASSININVERLAEGIQVASDKQLINDRSRIARSSERTYSEVL